MSSPDASLREKIRRRAHYKCHYCGQQLHRDNFTLDHVVPRAKGGTSAVYNLVASCYDCNQMKADADVWCSCPRCETSRERNQQRIDRKRAALPGCSCVRCAADSAYLS